MSRGRREQGSRGPEPEYGRPQMREDAMGLLVRCLAGLLALGLGATSALAADFDCQRVTLIVPYPAGGAADVAARLVGDRL
jgi:hypothetical protein